MTFCCSLIGRKTRATCKALFLANQRQALAITATWENGNLAIGNCSLDYLCETKWFLHTLKKRSSAIKGETAPPKFVPLQVVKASSPL